MITPACAVQMDGNSLGTERLNYEKKINPQVPMDYNKISTKKSEKIRFKSTSKTVKAGIIKPKYGAIIAHATKILPAAEKSYDQSSVEVSESQKTLKQLGNKKIEINNRIKQLETKLDKYEISNNNSGDYKKLQNEYQDCKKMRNNIIYAENSFSGVKSVLKKKQTHTQKCVVALKHITKSENIPASVKIYNSNIESLVNIGNNLQKNLQDKSGVIVRSNDTINNDTNSTDDVTNTTESTGTPINQNALLYSGIAVTALGGLVTIGGLTSILFVYAGTYLTYTATGEIGMAILPLVDASIGIVTASVYSTILTVTISITVIGFVVALIGAACLLGYYGPKKGWWKL